MKDSTHPYYGAMLVLLSSVAFSSKAIMVKLAYVYHVDTEALIALRIGRAGAGYPVSVSDTGGGDECAVSQASHHTA